MSTMSSLFEGAINMTHQQNRPCREDVRVSSVTTPEEGTRSTGHATAFVLHQSHCDLVKMRRLHLDAQYQTGHSLFRTALSASAICMHLLSNHAACQTCLACLSGHLQHVISNSRFICLADKITRQCSLVKLMHWVPWLSLPPLSQHCTDQW